MACLLNEVKVKMTELENVENPIKLVLSIDPGLRNLGLALISYNEKTKESRFVLSAHHDMEIGKKAPFIDIAKKVTDFFGKFNEFLYVANVKSKDVWMVLIENQGQGKPFEQLEGMIHVITSLLFPFSEFQTIYPRVVSRWTKQKFSGRTEKKKWTLEEMKKKYKKEITIDEADALLNYDYFISGFSKKKK